MGRAYVRTWSFSGSQRLTNFSRWAEIRRYCGETWGFFRIFRPSAAIFSDARKWFRHGVCLAASLGGCDSAYRATPAPDAAHSLQFPTFSAPLRELKDRGVPPQRKRLIISIKRHPIARRLSPPGLTRVLLKPSACSAISVSEISNRAPTAPCPFWSPNEMFAKEQR